MDQQLVDVIKQTIDENMLKKAMSCAASKELTLEGWFRTVIWDAIRQQESQ